MLVWTILTRVAWEQMLRKGCLRASRRHAEKDMLPSYDWIAGQMERRLSVPRPYKTAVPIWVWVQWEGQARRRPDLRGGGHLPSGTPGIRLELEVQDDRVLLSDFDLWHYVLNYWYLPKTEAQGDAFERKLAHAGLSLVGCNHSNPLPHAAFRRELEESWERIFDLSWTDPGYRITSPLKKRSIQGTLWELLATDVAAVTEFTAR
jgi:hypothetical protein